MKFEFLTKLKTSPVVGKTNWAVTVADFECYSERLGRKFVIKKGFKFDWDSIPRIMVISYAWLKNRAEKSACVHDWLYRYQPCSRATADAVMLDAMVTEKVARRHRWAIYAGVRAGGWLAWRRHRYRDLEIEPGDKRGGR